MKKLVTSIVFAAAVTSFGLAQAAEEGGEAHGLAAEVTHAIANSHFPVLKPKEMDWSFAGPFGHYDKAQLQRGLKVYTEVCSACHSMNLVAFRTLEDLGYSEAQVKAFAANYEVEDGPNGDGDMFTRKAVPSDHFPSPFANPEAAAASNGGAAPPDMSLLAKARGVTRGFPTFVFDIFTQYQEGGPDYIHALLTGYQDPPEGIKNIDGSDWELPEGTHFNPYFAGSPSLAMAPPISDDQVTYDDGSPQTVDQYSQDVAAFLMWAAEPHLEERKHTGFMVMVFLAIFTALIYLTKKSVYANKEH
ncbi:cytochrome c1 [Rhizobium sp. L1K21]|uniref:cytochrome c1 n=1 Tax=Rhizobium sp. L1K21 TaxID=2954933 RepID=UPI002093FAC7|nr:cytochrome c1 [Rhizobium sp. L1K21]MCO6185449.1 cytochrome c1 [Rhizobium sp. L1K21]